MTSSGNKGDTLIALTQEMYGTVKNWAWITLAYVNFWLQLFFFGKKHQIQCDAHPLTNSTLFCLRLFGDESDLQFWNVAAHYIKSFSQARQLSVPTPDGQTQPECSQSTTQCHLDICHDILCESSFFQVLYNTAHTVQKI